MRGNEQPTASDFNRSTHANPLDRIVQAATTYSRMATPEESDAMLRRVYGDDRMPGSEARRRSQTGRAWRACTVTGCGRKHYALGLCRSHYSRQRRTGEPFELLVSFEPRGARTIPSDAEVKAEMRAALRKATE